MSRPWSPPPSSGSAGWTPCLTWPAIGEGCMLGDVTTVLYDKVMDVDLRGVLFGMKHGIRAMLKSGGGSIVNWSSIGGPNASPGTSVYSAAKLA
jgi:NAD(P)-dependent dehydrogenase (short-subunit alcohol dehydrogenase family)